jgi:hypothetical protein
MQRSYNWNKLIINKIDNIIEAGEPDQQKNKKEEPHDPFIKTDTCSSPITGVY